MSNKKAPIVAVDVSLEGKSKGLAGSLDFIDMLSNMGGAGGFGEIMAGMLESLLGISFDKLDARLDSVNEVIGEMNNLAHRLSSAEAAGDLTVNKVVEEVTASAEALGLDEKQTKELVDDARSALAGKDLSDMDLEKLTDFTKEIGNQDWAEKLNDADFDEAAKRKKEIEDLPEEEAVKARAALDAELEEPQLELGEKIIGEHISYGQQVNALGLPLGENLTLHTMDADGNFTVIADDVSSRDVLAAIGGDKLDGNIGLQMTEVNGDYVGYRLGNDEGSVYLKQGDVGLDDIKENHPEFFERMQEPEPQALEISSVGLKPGMGYDVSAIKPDLMEPGMNLGGPN